MRVSGVVIHIKGTMTALTGIAAKTPGADCDVTTCQERFAVLACLKTGLNAFAKGAHSQPSGTSYSGG